MIGLEDNEPICKGNEALKKFVIERGFLPTPKDKPYYGILMKFHKKVVLLFEMTLKLMPSC